MLENSTIIMIEKRIDKKNVENYYCIFSEKYFEYFEYILQYITILLENKVCE